MTAQTWTVRVDRRAARWQEVADEIDELAKTVGATWSPRDLPAIEAEIDSGTFRDFVDIGRLTADRRVLEAVAEELVAEFGFLVDVVVEPGL